MNSVKLIALDIDGTLYNKDGVITSYNKEMIRKAIENGLPLLSPPAGLISVFLWMK